MRTQVEQVTCGVPQAQTCAQDMPPHHPTFVEHEVSGLGTAVGSSLDKFFSGCGNYMAENPISCVAAAICAALTILFWLFPKLTRRLALFIIWPIIILADLLAVPVILHCQRRLAEEKTWNGSSSRLPQPLIPSPVQ